MPSSGCAGWPAAQQIAGEKRHFGSIRLDTERPASTILGNPLRDDRFHPSLRNQKAGSYRALAGIGNSVLSLLIRAIAEHNRVLAASLRRYPEVTRTLCGEPHKTRVISRKRRSLRRILTCYFLYYHKVRTHLSLEKDTPEPREIQHPNLWPCGRAARSGRSPSSIRTPCRIALADRRLTCHGYLFVLVHRDLR